MDVFVSPTFGPRAVGGSVDGTGLRSFYPPHRTHVRVNRWISVGSEPFRGKTGVPVDTGTG